MNKHLLRITALLLALITVCGCFAGCSKTVKDAELRLPLSAEPDTLDPQIAVTRESRTVVLNCFEGLMKLTETGEIQPAAAKSVAVSPDGLAYSFKLHEDKKWHINSNHEEIFGEDWETAIDLRVTAADFVFGLQRALNPETKAPDAKKLYMIKNAEKVHKGELPVSALGVIATGEYTVQIQLEYASGEFLSMLAEPVSMPCKQVFFEATGGRHGLAAQYVLCNGSFYLSRWYKGSNMILRRNVDNPQAQAKVYSVTFAYTTDEAIILENLSDDTYAAAPILSSSIEAVEKEGCSVKEYKNGVWGLAFNCSDSLTRSNRLRLALIKALDFDVIREASGETDENRALSIVPPSCTIEGKTYSSFMPALGTLSYDETAAKKYYKECKLKSCEFTVLCTPEYETAVRRIIQKWQQLFGITFYAKVEVLEKAELDKRVNSGNYQCALTEFRTTAQTAVQFLSSFSDGNNICRYSSKNFNTLISQLNTATGLQSIADGCMKAQEYLIQNAVFCPLYYRSGYNAIHENSLGVYYTHSGSIIRLDTTEILKD